MLLAEIDETRTGDERFADDRSPTLLQRLAAEALTADEAGLTEPLEALLAEVEAEAARQPDTRR